MHYPLTFTTAVSTALNTGAALTAAARPMGDTTDKATPQLGLIVEDFSSPHQQMHRGTLVLRYEFDVDTTTMAAATADLTAATDYLLSGPGRAALQDLLSPSGIWLRILNLATPSTTATETGDRARTMDATIPFWIQTARP